MPFTGYIDEDFEGYPIGAITPFGPWIGTPGPGEIASEPGSKADSLQVCAIEGTIATQIPVPAGIAQGFITFSYIYGGAPGGAKICAITNGPWPPGGGNTFNLLYLTVEPDATLSLTNDAGFLVDSATSKFCNSGLISGFSLHPNTFYWIQMNFTLTLRAVSGVQTVFVSGGASVEGVGLFNSLQQTTGHNIVPPDGVFTGTAVTTGLSFDSSTSLFFGGAVDNITLAAPPNSGWPHPATPPGPNVRISQMAIEYMYKNQKQPNVRNSQMAIEFMASPVNRKVRDSQMAIEIMRKNTGPPINTGRWLVKES